MGTLFVECPNSKCAHYSEAARLERAESALGTYSSKKYFTHEGPSKTSLSDPDETPVMFPGLRFVDGSD